MPDQKGRSGQGKSPNAPGETQGPGKGETSPSASGEQGKPESSGAQGSETQSGQGKPSEGQGEKSSAGSQPQAGGQQGSQAGQQSGQSATGGNSNQGGKPTSEPGRGTQQGGPAGRAPVGGGPSEGTASNIVGGQDNSKPSPPAAEPENPPNDDVAPEGQAQSDMVLRAVKDLLANDKVTPDIEKATGMNREQMEHFVKKYEARKSAPAGPGREVEVKPGEPNTKDRPGSNLPGIDRQSRFTNKNLKDRGTMATDDARDNLEGIRFTPPPELRGKFEAFKSTLAKSRTRTAPRPAPARATGAGGQ
jgi:hypothetical protein